MAVTTTSTASAAAAARTATAAPHDYDYDYDNDYIDCRGRMYCDCRRGITRLRTDYGTFCGSTYYDGYRGRAGFAFYDLLRGGFTDCAGSVWWGRERRRGRLFTGLSLLISIHQPPHWPGQGPGELS